MGGVTMNRCARLVLRGLAGRTRHGRFRGTCVAFVLTGALAGCSAGPGESVGTSTQAITFPNDLPAFDYFVAKGLTDFQAAGIVGNLDQESGVGPTIAQSGGGPGRGIAQWSVGGRWDTDAMDNATWFQATKAATEPLLSLQLQLDFVWYELTTFPAYGLAKLQATTNVADATVAFETDFEGCGTCDESQRIAYAENVLAAFGGSAGDGGVAPGDAGGTACTLPTTGETGECIDTTTCAALGSHISTPNLCPGATNIQCCTAVPSTTAGDAASDTATGPPKDAASATGDGGLHPAAPEGGASDAATEGGRAVDGGSTGGGCSAARSRDDRTAGSMGLLGIGGIAATRRRSRVRRAGSRPRG
jgi:hypothetical protein